MIAQRREQLVNESLRRQNLKRRTYDYVVGQRVLKKVHNPTKLAVFEPKVRIQFKQYTSMVLSPLS